MNQGENPQGGGVGHPLPILPQLDMGHYVPLRQYAPQWAVLGNVPTRKLGRGAAVRPRLGVLPRGGMVGA